MAVDEHVVEENTDTINAENKKIRNTVLDHFRKLTHNKEKIRMKSGIALLKHIFDNKDDENGKHELKYALNRLIRGLGASKDTSKIGFYTVLVALFNSIEDISVSDVFEHVKKELHSSGSNSKSENADIYGGQVLFYGALIRSNLYERASRDEKKYALEQLLLAGKKRNYLYLSSIAFIKELCEKTDVNEFKLIIWPLLRLEVEKPWQDQSVDTIYLLYSLRNKFSAIVNKKFLRQVLDSDDLCSKDTFKPLSNILLNIPRITGISHPIYELIAKDICCKNLTSDFIKEVDETLIRFNYNRHLIATKLISYCVTNTPDVDILPDLLNKNYIQHTLQYFKSVKSSKNTETLQEGIYSLFNAIIEVLKKDDTKSDTKIRVLKKLLFYPGIFIFEKITRSKIVQSIIATFNSDGVEKLAGLYRNVILGKNESFIQNGEQQACFNNDKVYASQLLVKLLSHPNSDKKIAWKIEQLKFLMDLSLFRNAEGRNVSVELAASLKDTFYRALNLNLPKLKDLRELLSNLVVDINNRLNQQQLLRNPLTDEGNEMWTKSLEYIHKLESKHKKVYSVFHTLVLHMSLQLFNDTKLATDSLKELYVCYERIRSDKGHLDETNTDDPLWIEVVVDLFLNLLSHKSSLLRNLINYVFPHLCKYLNVTAMHQILDVLDPKNEGNPLIASDESEDENEDVDSETDNESEDSDESADEDEEMEDNVNDKLKMAVQMALGGYKSDEESIDLDQMSETEGKQLDEALATAFKQFKPNIGKKSKKQKKEDEALTHFRVRVLDLIDLYLESEPSMYICLEIMVILLRILEFAIKDEHQKPLLNRTRSSLKKLSNVKKFKSIDDIEETTLSDLFNSLLEKGTKNFFIMQEMNDKISECCLFVIRCVEYLNSLEDVPKKIKKHSKKAIVSTISQSLEMYFTKRECYVPYGLFKSVMMSTWVGTFKLIPLVLQYIFDDEVKVFKKCQAIELGKIFFGNHRLLNMYTTVESFDETLQKFSENTVSFFNNPESDIKEKFVRDLMILLSVLKKSPVNHELIQWKDIGEKLIEFRTSVAIVKPTKVAFNKLCRVLQIDSNVTLKPNLIKLAGNVELSAQNGEITDKKSNKVKIDSTVKAGKKEKKLKTQASETNKLKKETQMLRIQSLSDGLSIDFTEVGLKNENLDDSSISAKRTHSDENTTEESDESPRKKMKNSKNIESKLLKKRKKKNNSN